MVFRCRLFLSLSLTKEELYWQVFYEKNPKSPSQRFIVAVVKRVVPWQYR